MTALRATKALVGFAAGLTVASCIIQAQPDPAAGPTDKVAPASAESEGSARKLAAGSVLEVPAGNYSCTIDRYDPFPCRVTKQRDGSLRLEKLAGSQRFSGIIDATANGFAFRGTYYCPHGDCTQPVSGEFVAYDDGLYRGKLSTDNGPTTVTIQYTEYGGYGGNLYGGNLYGGMLYGGNLYGGYYPPKAKPKKVPYKPMPYKSPY